jgi:SOS response regulatory protein OraA/RecX
MRELQARGVSRDTAAEAIGDVFGDKDERALVNRAIKKKLRGKARASDPAEHARLYQFLMRQGFTPAVVTSVLRKLRPADASLEDEEVQ